MCKSLEKGLKALKYTDSTLITIESHISIFNTHLQQILDTDGSYISSFKAREAFMESLVSSKTQYWRLSAMKDNTSMKDLQAHLRNWELSSDTHLGPLIPTVQYGNPTNRRTGISTRDENAIDEEYLLYQRRQVRKDRRGLKGIFKD